MREIITTYLLVVVLLSIGFIGFGAIASAEELRDPMQRRIQATVSIDPP
ncbi:MAG: hypothetical protein JSU67_09205 [Gammaproteobacteria bacterium]|nr:MAG: hypothetical protein JSU67_09205 [Gammaproteobacteria bacterium]